MKPHQPIAAVILAAAIAGGSAGIAHAAAGKQGPYAEAEVTSATINQNWLTLSGTYDCMGSAGQISGSIFAEAKQPGGPVYPGGKPVKSTGMAKVLCDGTAKSWSVQFNGRYTGSSGNWQTGKAVQYRAIMSANDHVAKNSVDSDFAGEITP